MGDVRREEVVVGGACRLGGAVLPACTARGVRGYSSIWTEKVRTARDPGDSEKPAFCAELATDPVPSSAGTISTVPVAPSMVRAGAQAPAVQCSRVVKPGTVSLMTTLVASEVPVLSAIRR